MEFIDDSAVAAAQEEKTKDEDTIPRRRYDVSPSLMA